MSPGTRTLWLSVLALRCGAASANMSQQWCPRRIGFDVETQPLRAHRYGLVLCQNATCLVLGMPSVSCPTMGRTRVLPTKALGDKACAHRARGAMQLRNCTGPAAQSFGKFSKQPRPNIRLTPRPFADRAIPCGHQRVLELGGLRRRPLEPRRPSAPIWRVDAGRRAALGQQRGRRPRRRPQAAPWPSCTLSRTRTAG